MALIFAAHRIAEIGVLGDPSVDGASGQAEDLRQFVVGGAAASSSYEPARTWQDRNGRDGLDHELI
jgi:hypothetical protein